MAENIRSIGSDVSRDHATDALWAVNHLNGLTFTSGTDEVGEVYNDSLFGLGATSSYTTTISNGSEKVILRAAPGESFNDHANKLTNPLFPDQSYGVLFEYTSNAINIDISNFEMEGLQYVCKNNYTNIIDVNTSVSTDPIFRRSMFLHQASNGGTYCVIGGGADFERSLLIQDGNNAVAAAQIAYGGMTFNGCGIIRTKSGSTGFGINEAGGASNTLDLKNTAIFNFSTDIDTGWGTLTGDYNASDGTGMPGANSVDSLTYADQFENVTNNSNYTLSNADFTPKTTGGLAGAGNPATLPTLDILEQTQSGDYIGARDIIVSGADIQPSNANLVFSTLSPLISISDNHIISPPVGELILSTSAPIVEVITGITIVVPQTNMIFSTTIPIAIRTDNHAQAPPAGDLIFSTIAPIVDRTANVESVPPHAGLTLTTTSPIVSSSQHVFALPLSGSLILDSQAPIVSVTENHFITPPQGDLVLATTSPLATLTDQYDVTPPAGALILDSVAPDVTVTAHHAITVPVGDLILSGSAPDVQSGDHVVKSSPQGNLVFSTTAPVVEHTENHVIVVPQGNLVFSIEAPVVVQEDHHSITVPVGDLVLTTSAPIVSTAVNHVVLPGAANLVFTTTTPTISISDNHLITIPQGNLILSGASPVLFQEQHVIFVVPKGDLVFTTTVPVVLIETGWVDEAADHMDLNVLEDVLEVDVLDDEWIINAIEDVLTFDIDE